METKMSGKWQIDAKWEDLTGELPEEQACFASVGIRISDVWLTEGYDALLDRMREAPLLSAYHLAEWLAWSWWRLRWEPRSSHPDWVLSHNLTTIGNGYVWPNITINSDGEHISFFAKPDAKSNQPFRYIADLPPFSIRASEFEAVLDEFMEKVLERLHSKKIKSTNLELLWKDVKDERQQPELSRVRKMEALLGLDPDEGNKRIITKLFADEKEMGRMAMEEIAADHRNGNVIRAEELHEMARNVGHEGSVRDAVRLNGLDELPVYGELPAWKKGALVAQKLREQEKLDGNPVDDDRLESLSGIYPQSLEEEKRCHPQISFALDVGKGRNLVVLKSKYKTGRRFDLARILCDRIFAKSDDHLYPATLAYTYRQQLQRSFAAYFLSPFEAVEEMLDGDYSYDKQQDVAIHFDVSPLTIRTMLVNHNRILREELE